MRMFKSFHITRAIGGCKMCYSSLRAIALLLAGSFVLAACGQPVDPEPDNIITGVNYVGLSVADLDRSLTFYEGPAQLTRVGDAKLETDMFPAGLGIQPEAVVNTYMLRSANAQVRLMQFKPLSDAAKGYSPIEVYGPGIAHVCYQVAKDTGAYQKFLAAGAQVIGDPNMVRLSDRNPVEYAYTRDLDGAIFEVEHVDVAALDLPEPPKNRYRIRHVSLATPDMNRAVDFYEAFLGGQESRRVGRFWSLSGDKLDQVSGEKDSEIEMAWFQIRNLELELIQYHSHSLDRNPKPRPIDAPGYNMIMFDVADIDGAKDRLVKAGGTIVSKVIEMDGGKVLFGRDPDGNLLGLQKVPADAMASSQNFANNGL